ncbi:transglycosylase SLT domain-containing protein [Sphingomicrobium astaxanthinifaciens]|uniref:transglycosylase SLT domain-containing protein n=1 Tax=Sphingomicrobium astaxanthinifaciens TaxID=1227949 RepID=UPI001FCB9171|nr:transglycosylase SLT domain-containing protein [Sphingomicrobium astaxanthinifaciens]MCJ7422349.1 transglycosylase SLT domain-containing protein [Sphingomicrobium astaxanthinifaciens]
MKALLGAVIGAAVLLPAPLAAQADPLAPLPPGARQEAPAPLLADWPAIFRAIDAGQWDQARRSIAAMEDGVLAPYALAQLYLAPNSPRVSGAEASALVRRAPELPQAERLAALAAERGGDAVAALPARPLVGLGGAPRRTRARSTATAAVETLRAALRPAIEADDGAAAEALYRAALAEGRLGSGEEQAEIAQLAAWIHYVAGDLDGARRLAAEGVAAGRGEWRAQAAWTLGLAAWRQHDCRAASDAFRTAAAGTRDTELRSAAHYWTARAEQRCRRPQAVAPYLGAAAREVETFYGQLARERLGLNRRLAQRVGPSDRATRARVEALPNVVRARALVAMGERERATELLRHQARIGAPGDHKALVEVAGALRLGLQYWLATNGPRGALVDPADRYPAPGWQPDNGWRIDPFLVFSHIIQESDFREGVVSSADAIGLMQVRPGTASDTARRRGQSISREALKRPEANLDHGQAFIEAMRANGATHDELLRVIAAYNAGPVPVARWAAIPGDDPLLWMESLPYWETRFYIPAILRNYFVYHAEAGSTPQALTDLVQGRTPRFPAR